MCGSGILGKDGDEHIHLSCYVDDGKIYCDNTPAGKKAMNELKKAMLNRWDVKNTRGPRPQLRRPGPGSI